MEASILLARFWGIFLSVTSLLFLCRKRLISEDIFLSLEDRKVTFVFGFLFLILGLFTIILHNFWKFEWRLLITIFGWTSLIKGVTFIFLPEFIQRLREFFKKRILLLRLIFTIFLILGGWLIFLSYF